MSRSLTMTERHLLALVRTSLWGFPVETSFPSGSVDWNDVARLALQQTVGVAAFEGALSLPSGSQPPKSWRMKALPFIETNRRTGLLVDRCVGEAVSALQSRGLSPVLLKGQAYARAYPEPGMRQCGDIDLYVGEDDYRLAFSVVERLGWEMDEDLDPEGKHFGCKLRGVRIEVHRKAAKILSSESDREFQEWSRRQIMGSGRKMLIADKEIPVPSPVFDIVFVFQHLYHHFLNGGVGLRHLCDWTMLLHAHASDIETGELEKLLREFRLLRPWKMFAPIAVRHLGLPEDECPFFSDRYGYRSMRALSMIMKEGNFGRIKSERGKRPDGYWRGKVYSLNRLTRNYAAKVSLDPYAVARLYSGFLISGLAGILRDKTIGRRR